MKINDHSRPEIILKLINKYSIKNYNSLDIFYKKVIIFKNE